MLFKLSFRIIVQIIWLHSAQTKYSETLTKPVSVSGTEPFGTDLTVEVQYNYSFLIIPNFIPGVAALEDMRAVTVMRYE